MIAFWNYFIYFAVAAVLLWATGAYAAWKDKKIVAYSATIVGLAVFFSYILIMWIALDRPPMRTMGETRLWYSFFLPLQASLFTVVGTISGYCHFPQYFLWFSFASIF